MKIQLRERIEHGLSQAELKNTHMNTRRGHRRMKVNLRARLIEAMEDSGVRQCELAEYLGYARSELSLYLNGKQGLPYDLVEEVLWLLGY